MLDVRQIPTSQFMLLGYIIKDVHSNECIVVDPPREIGKFIDPDFSIKAVINTHIHPDHTLGNVFFKGKAPILAHETEKNLMLRVFNAGLGTVLTKKMPAPIQFTLSEGEKICLGQTIITVMHTPGHSPGSICLYWPGNLISGDTVFAEGIGRTDIPGGSNVQMKKSLEKIMDLPDDTRIWPGHFYGNKYTALIQECRPLLQYFLKIL
jgi:glyoxylase-like metal-dependent hydrolase (beta-lactamase superfamily II)